MNRNIQIALLGITIAGITFGLITPVTVVLLEKISAGSTVIGVITTINYLPFVLFSSCTGRAINKYGIKRIMSAGFVVILTGVAGHIFWENIFILLPIRFLTGVGSTFIFVSTEVLINNTSNNKSRSKNIGLYVVLLSAGIAIGTLLVWTVEIFDTFPFIIGLLIMFVAFVVQHIGIKHETNKVLESSAKKFNLSQIPSIAIVSSFIYGIFESSIFVALPLFLLRNYFNTSQVSYLLSSLVLGGIILLYFLSRFFNSCSNYGILLYVSLILSFLFISPIVSLNNIFLIVMLFLIGGLIPVYYTVGLNYTMDQVKKRVYSGIKWLFSYVLWNRNFNGTYTRCFSG